MRYTHQIEWTEQHKQYGKVNKQFKTTKCAVGMHEMLLKQNTEVLSWKTTRIEYNETTKKYEPKC